MSCRPWPREIFGESPQNNPTNRNLESILDFIQISIAEWGNLQRTSAMLIIGLQRSRAGALEAPSSCSSSMKVRPTHLSPRPSPLRGCLVHDPCMH